MKNGKVDVLFINPLYRLDTARSLFPPYIPRALILLASCLRDVGFSVGIHDMPPHELHYGSIAACLEEYQPRVVGMGIHGAPFVARVKKCAEVVKATSPDTPIITGGLAASLLGEETFSLIPEIDCIVLGEAENAIVETVRTLCESGDLSAVSGLVYQRKSEKMKEQREIVRTSLRLPRAGDQVSYPFPAYDLLDMPAYIAGGVVPHLETTRGCPFKCTFCGTHFQPYKQTYRYRALDDCLDEIAEVVDRYGIRSFHLCDAELLVNHERQARLYEGFINRNLHISWRGMTRVDTLLWAVSENPGLIDLMRASGCCEISLGAESGSQEILNSVDKRITLEQSKEAIHLLKAAGIGVNLYIILGFPKESHQTIQQTFQFAEASRPTTCQFFIFHPLPGTPEYQQHRSRIRLNNAEDWMQFDNMDSPFFGSEHISKEYIIKYYIRFNYALPTKLDERRNDGLINRLHQSDQMPRRKEGVNTTFIGRNCLEASDGVALCYNPSGQHPEGEQRADLYRNVFPLSMLQYEVLLHCNGDILIEEIAALVGRLLNVEFQRALEATVEVLKEFERWKIIDEIPALEKLY